MRTLELNKLNLTKGIVVRRLSMIKEKWDKAYSNNAGENIIEPLRESYYDLADYNIKLFSLQKIKL